MFANRVRFSIASLATTRIDFMRAAGLGKAASAAEDDVAVAACDWILTLGVGFAIAFPSLSELSIGDVGDILPGSTRIGWSRSWFGKNSSRLSNTTSGGGRTAQTSSCLANEFLRVRSVMKAREAAEVDELGVLGERGGRMGELRPFLSSPTVNSGDSARGAGPRL